MQKLFKQLKPHVGMLLLGASILVVLLVIAGCAKEKPPVQYWDNLAKGAKHVGSKG